MTRSRPLALALVIATASAIAGACSTFDAATTPEPADASADSEATSDAPNDGAAALVDASTCATKFPKAIFCDDFDTATLDQKGWVQVKATTEPALVDVGESFSPPRSLAYTYSFVPEVENGPHVMRSGLDPSGRPTLMLHMMLKLESPIASGRLAFASIAPDGLDKAHVRLTANDSGFAIVILHGDDAGAGDAGPIFEQTPFPTTTAWTSVDLELAYGESPPKLRLFVETQGHELPMPAELPPPGPGMVLVVGDIASSATDAGAKSGTLHVDDFVLYEP